MAIKGEILLPAIMGAALFALAQPACAQYPGRITKTGKETPELRSIAVLEWTGDPGKPKASRLVPVAVLDAGTLQDGGIYLARPQPLALSGEVEYELQENGRPTGLFDIRSAGQEQGSWVGFGTWKPLTIARPKPAHVAPPKVDEGDYQSDTPVLHRKHHAGDSSSGTGSDSSSDSEQAPAADPDRPTLHKKDSSDSSSSTSTTTASSSTSSDPNAPVLHKKDSGDSSDSTSATSASSSTSSDPNAPVLHKKDSSDSSDSTSTTTTSSSTASDPDRPTLHRGGSADNTGSSSTTSDSNGPTLHKKTSDDDSASAGAPSSDPDRPVLKKKKQQQTEDVGHVDSLADVTDPDRPRLMRGQSGGNNLEVTPTLMGLPADLQQAVAVSDAKPHPAHPWTYSWANPGDEAKMKSAMEDMARDALGLNPPPAPPKPAPKKTTATSHKAAKPAPPPPAPPEPAPLGDEQFRTFELAYGSGATLVLTAHTGGPAAQMKFVTLVAQPDLYGKPLVLLKSITDTAHLDERPRMRLVDAVDAMADNRGELLFELRGATQRQFALYRVLRGQAEKLFVSGGAEFAAE